MQDMVDAFNNHQISSFMIRSWMAPNCKLVSDSAVIGGGAARVRRVSVFFAFFTFYFFKEGHFSFCFGLLQKFLTN
jgi:hypothetical protein